MRSRVSVVLLGVLSVAYARGYVRQAAIEQELARLEEERELLQKENAAISDWSESLQTQFFLEGEGRRKLGLAKEGERLVILSDEEGDDSSQPFESEEGDKGLEAAAETTPLAQQNFSLWWQYFFGGEWEE
jgi:cell division protein FtsB